MHDKDTQLIWEAYEAQTDVLIMEGAVLDKMKEFLTREKPDQVWKKLKEKLPKLNYDRLDQLNKLYLIFAGGLLSGKAVRELYKFIYQNGPEEDFLRYLDALKNLF